MIVRTVIAIFIYLLIGHGVVLGTLNRSPDLESERIVILFMWPLGVGYLLGITVEDAKLLQKEGR